MTQDGINLKESLSQFLEWFKLCSGYEKGEGQLFFENLLKGFGNPGVLQVGAKCEKAVKRNLGKSTGFSDFMWGNRVIIELKKRGEPLQKHYDQAYEYWRNLAPDQPKYMALCNFDEFWIYELKVQTNDPIHILKTENILEDWKSLSFLLPVPDDPEFSNNQAAITEEVAKIVGHIYISLTGRKIPPERAQRFVLQLVVALFAEDVGLIPKDTLLNILRDAVRKPVTQEELTNLFTAMATKEESQKPDKYKHIEYFNGGIFTSVEPVELTFEELIQLHDASNYNWSKVRPSIFGGIFESSIDEKARHERGIHFTSEHDIQKIVFPTIVKPFKEKIQKAGKTKKKLGQVLDEIMSFKVLDPACGSGNFLYIAFRELRRLEYEILELMGQDKTQRRFISVSPKNFYGIDTNKFAIELAKISLSIGRKLSADEFGIVDIVLPFDDLHENFSDKDALLEATWPKCNAIIGNPPFIDARNIKDYFGIEYTEKLRKIYKSVPGRADYCVYWLKKTHDHLQNSHRAGLVGTNSIRQNYSREGGLDYIVNNNGTITEAVSTQIWSGDAAVRVSIVNWIKGQDDSIKLLFTQLGDTISSDWKIEKISHISSSLSSNVDLKDAVALDVNIKPKSCFEGLQPGHDSFRLTKEEMLNIVKKEPIAKDVIFPYLNGNELLTGKFNNSPRYIINFKNKELPKCLKYKQALNHIEKNVLPDWKINAENEYKKTGKKIGEHQNRIKTWWQLKRQRAELTNKISKLSRYIARPRLSKQPVFVFLNSKILPDSQLTLFTFSDDYSFGILQSDIHLKWFIARCSTLGSGFRYTSQTVHNHFPWPQSPTVAQIKDVSKYSRELRLLQTNIMQKENINLRELYRTLELPGKNPIKDAHDNLTKAVKFAYGIDKNDDTLQFLLKLNLELSEKEKNGETIIGPGLPPCIKDPKPYISDDCINMDY